MKSQEQSLRKVVERLEGVKRAQTYSEAHAL